MAKTPEQIAARKARKQAKLDAMTPEQLAKYRADKSARKRANKATKKAKAVAASKITVRAALTEHENKEAVKAMNESAIRNHKLNKNSAKVQDEIKSAGEAYRNSEQYQNAKAAKEWRERCEVAARERKEAEKKKKVPYTFQLRSVKKAKTDAEKLVAVLWNEAVNQRHPNPYDYINDALARERAKFQQAKTVVPAYEHRPQPTGKRFVVVNGVVEYL